MLRADESVFLWINHWVGTCPVFDSIIRWIVSDYLIPVSMMIVMVAMWFLGKDRETRLKTQQGIFVALGSMGFSSLAVFLINIGYFRERPFVNHDIQMLFYQPTDSSFPANSTAAIFGLAAAVWGINHKLGYILFAIAGVFGFARIYAGVHYPLDILASAGIGIVIALLTYQLKNLLQPLPTWVIKLARVFCLA